MDSTCKLSAVGIQLGHDPQAVKAQLQFILKGDPSAFEDLFHRILRNERVILGENIPRAKAETMLQKLTALGLQCRLDPMALSLVSAEEEEQLNEVYRCPACGHCQPPARGGALDTCQRCGIVGKTYEEANEIKQALELERRRQQAVMEKEKKEKLEAAKAKADRQREKAQQKIAVRAQRQAEPDVNQPLRGLKAPLQPDVLYLIIGSVVVALIGIGLLVWQLG
jgi:ribosomal protein L37AE/L43A